MFKGKGRLVLLVDGWLTRHDNPSSYLVSATINSAAMMRFDLRPWGQKFAYYYGEWEKDYIDLARALYCGGVFVDVGSSLGLYVICLGDLVRKAGGAIVSIERVAFNLEKQKSNVAINGLEDLVVYYRVALGDQDTTLSMTVDASESDHNAFVSREGGINVEVTTLDSLVAKEGIQKIGFIKMDVEGYEPMVVCGGGEQTIRRDHPIILAEFNRDRMRINGFDIFPAWDFLGEEGYRGYRVFKRKLLALSEPGEVENIFFIPTDVQLPQSLLA